MPSLLGKGFGDVLLNSGLDDLLIKRYAMVKNGTAMRLMIQATKNVQYPPILSNPIPPSKLPVATPGKEIVYYRTSFT